MTAQQDCTQKQIRQGNGEQKRGANKTANFCEVGEENERQIANNVNCEEMRFMIRNLVMLKILPDMM